MQDLPDDTEEKILNLLIEGKRLEAIQLYHQASEKNLHESMEFIDRLAQGGKKPMASRDEMILSLVRQGNMLQAVKLYKDQTGSDLRSSKEYVDQLAIANGLGDLVSRKGCFVATACYGDYDAPEVRLLRRFRDETLANNFAGRIFIRLYYSISPPFARALSRSEKGKELVRRWLLLPVIRKLNRRF